MLKKFAILKYSILILYSYIVLPTFGQSPCSESTDLKTDPEIVSFIERLLEVDMMSNTYVIIPCYEIENFEAELLHNTRRIYYNPRIVVKELSRLSFSRRAVPVTSQSNWSLLTILAHEIGHHINDHFSPINSKLSPHSKELEADTYAGSLIYKIGGTLEQAKLAYRDEPENSSSTHPGRYDRMMAIEKGWRKIDSMYQRNKNYETILHPVIFSTNGKGKLYIDNVLINEIDTNETINRNLKAGFYNIKYISSINNLDSFSRRIKLVNPENGQAVSQTKVHLDIASISGFREEKGRLLVKQADSLFNLYGYQSAESKYRAAANLYNPDGMFMLGEYYLNGYAGLSKNEKEAYGWYLRSANLGNTNAMKSLGLFYRLGKGPVSKNIEIALDWYKKSIELNNSSAMLDLAEWYRYGGDGLNQNNQNAYEWYLRAASLNNVDALYKLGHIFSYGELDKKKDLLEAQKWYMKGTNLRNPACMVRLGELLLESGSDKQKGLSLIEEAASIKNDIGAIYALKSIYTEGKYGIQKDGYKAIDWLLELASNDDRNAIYSAYSSIAYIYEKGMGVEQDIMEALKWYKESIKGDHDDHSNYLSKDARTFCYVCNNLQKIGDIYYYGSGQKVQIDYTTALKYYSQIEGNTFFEDRLFFNLAWMHENGLGTSKNIAKSNDYYKLAANEGNSLAMNNLAWNYFNGNGIAKNIGTAKYWFEKAIEVGGQVNSYYGLGWVHRQQGYIDFEKFKKNLIKAGELGHKWAYYYLGDFYYTILGIGDNYGNSHFFTDKKLSLEYFNLSRNQGNVNALERIGRIYESGEKNKKGEWLISRDKKLAKELIEEACKKGLESSCKYLKTKDWGNILL